MDYIKYNKFDNKTCHTKIISIIPLLMSEGDFTPRSYRPKPLSRAQLKKMKQQYEKASERIDEIKKLEESHREEESNPEWV